MVLYKDKSLLTGWGDGAPSYHPQFRQIAGVVIFSSRDPKLLQLQLQRGVSTETLRFPSEFAEKIGDGLRKFTSFTNRLKNLPGKTRDAVFKKTKTVDMADLRKRKDKIPARGWTKDQKLNREDLDPPLPKFGDDNTQIVHFHAPRMRFAGYPNSSSIALKKSQRK